MTNTRDVLLQTAAITLKKEYIGLDDIIDEILDGLSSWYLYPELQTKPTIINLWGLTGTGKSSVVRRMVELLELDHRFYPFDLNEKEGRDWHMRRILEITYIPNTRAFPVLLFDEFQHARTLSENGNERGQQSSNLVWQLMDTGSFPSDPSTSFLQEAAGVLKAMQTFIADQHGRVVNGQVVHGGEYFKKTISKFAFYEEDMYADACPFILPAYHALMQRIMKHRFATDEALLNHINGLDETESMALFQEFVQQLQKPTMVDLSGALIFVIGNLDEVFTMSGQLGPDADADLLHKQANKINLPDIKEALSKRFRSEQIARLGNTHIVYPSFSAAQYKKIIQRELEKLTDGIWHTTGLKMELDDSIHQFVYEEGVFPTQGVRPVQSTIRHHIAALLGKVVSAHKQYQNINDTVQISIKNQQFYVELLKDFRCAHELFFPVRNKLQSVRSSLDPNRQAIVAVHESGHALVQGIALGKLPASIFSRTANPHSGGFVSLDISEHIINKGNIIDLMAVFLGGYVAEELVFGEDYITTGSKGDIRKASHLLLKMLREEGMGELPIRFNDYDDYKGVNYRDPNYSIEHQASEIIREAYDLARFILTNNRPLFTELIQRLQSVPHLFKDDLQIIFANHGFDATYFAKKKDPYVESLGDFIAQRATVCAE